MTFTRLLGGEDYWAPGSSVFDTTDPYDRTVTGVDPLYPEASGGLFLAILADAAVVGRNGLVAAAGGSFGHQPFASFFHPDAVAFPRNGRFDARYKITSLPADTGNGTSIVDFGNMGWVAYPSAGVTGGAPVSKGMVVGGTHRADLDWAALVGTLVTFRMEWYEVGASDWLVRTWINDVATVWNNVDSPDPLVEHAVGTDMHHDLSAFGSMVAHVNVGDPGAGNNEFTWALDDWSLDEALGIRGAFVAGETTTVRASRAAAFGLDGAVNEHTEEGKLKVFGQVEATETVQVGDVSGVTATALIGYGTTTALEAVTVGAGLALAANVLTATGGGSDHYDAPLSDGDLTAADLIYAAGECIIVQVPV